LRWAWPRLRGILKRMKFVTVSTYRICVLGLVFSILFIVASAQTQAVLQSSQGHDARHVQSGPGLAPATELEARFNAQLTVADAAKRGEAWFVFSADLDPAGPEGLGPQHVTIRIPISSTEDAYGESRSCTVAPDGSKQLTFSAGLDEDNFVRFAAAEKSQDFHFLLNKYLCRTLAAPFHCGEQELALPRDIARWRVATDSSLVLSTDAPAAMQVSVVAITAGTRSFDYARCEVVAPSNGMCCVAGKTTEWHCGGTPVGEGWRQVSGECFHRETGGKCTE